MRILILSALFVLCAAASALADDVDVNQLTVLSANAGVQAPQQMTRRYLERLAQQAFDQRRANYETLKTPEQLAAHQQRMRKNFEESLGGFPERTPLNAQVVGTVAGDGFRVEKVIFESQPQHYVTAVLYLPDVQPPYPAVIVPSGHSRTAKAADYNQRVCIFLAKSGIAAMAYDPIGQGERYQLLNADGTPRFGSTTEHSLLGVGSILLGRGTASFRVWDAMRAIDYLCSRKEIDPARIGSTGCSGGGTLTSYVMALDDRVACAAPSCYLTSFERLLATLGPQDAEQNIFGQIAAGMEHADYVMMRAPKPTLFCVATQDFFDIQGAWTNFRESKRFYSRLGYPERVDLIETDTKHGYPQAQREAMVRWMSRWLLDKDEAITEPAYSLISEKDLLCTPRGQVMLIDGARSVVDLNVAETQQLAAARKRLWQQPDKQPALAEVRRITGIRPLAELPQPTIDNVGTIQRDGYRIDKLVLRTEAGILLPSLAFVPSRPDGDAYLYVNGDGKKADAGTGGPIEELVKAGHVVLAIDVRGCGETGRPAGDGHFGSDWNGVWLAYLLGKSYLAMRAEDTLCAARFLASYETNGVPRKVHVIGLTEAAPAVLHAAALEPDQFASVKLSRSLNSWTSVVATPDAKNQLVNAVHGALRAYDLPDLIASLPQQKLKVESPVDAAGAPLTK
jgi:dienelactone hydrolase